MKQVALDIRWTELFGTRPEEIEGQVRRKRWEEWKRLGLREGSESVATWSTPNEPCMNCRYRDDDWCTAVSLPCTVNPNLTFQFGMNGLACGGAAVDKTAK